jgi:hypothetical protein
MTGISDVTQSDLTSILYINTNSQYVEIVFPCIVLNIRHVLKKSFQLIVVNVN